MNELQGHGLPKPEGLIFRSGKIDIGPGIKPVHWFFPHKPLCVEPYGPYAERLRAAGYKVAEMTALAFLGSVDVRDCVVTLLDVIEHMERDDGLAVLAALKDAAQVVIFTPNGFMPQDKDHWGLGGDHWQTHRSGWVPEDFPGWRIQHYAKSFFAVRP